MMKTIKNKEEILVLPEVVWLLKEVADTHCKGHQRANMPKTKGLVWGSCIWQAAEMPVGLLQSYPLPLPITASSSTNLSLERRGKGLLPRHKTESRQKVDLVRLQNHFVWIRPPIWALPDWSNCYLTRHCSPEWWLPRLNLDVFPVPRSTQNKEQRESPPFI